MRLRRFCCLRRLRPLHRFWCLHRLLGFHLFWRLRRSCCLRRLQRLHRLRCLRRFRRFHRFRGLHRFRRFHWFRGLHRFRRLRRTARDRLCGCLADGVRPARLCLQHLRGSPKRLRRGPRDDVTLGAACSEHLGAGAVQGGGGSAGDDVIGGVGAASLQKRMQNKYASSEGRLLMASACVCQGSYLVSATGPLPRVLLLL